MCFIKFDKKLLKTGLSPRAMILYALISNRISISEQNEWKDSFGGVYCYYTMEAIAKEMCIEKRQARRLIAELEAAKLILRQRQDGNRTKPFKIYIAPIKNEGSKMSSHEGSKMSPKLEEYNNKSIISSSSGSSVDELISAAEAQTGKSLSKEGRKKIKQVVAEHKSKIGNLSAYIRRCVINTATLENLEEEPAGYAPTYDIAEYERTSIADFSYWRDDEDQEKGGE